MSIATGIAIRETQLWPQGDARDPLGVWGARLSVTNDASGGDVAVDFFVPEARRHAFVYTCYAAQISQTVGALQAGNLSARILTNWPNIDPSAGIQGFSTINVVQTNDAGDTSPFTGPDEPMIKPNDRFILCYDPSPQTGDMSILQLKLQINTDTLVYAFEAYGYYWDREVMLTPGGPRHPGSS